jgi:hypothetical protein
MNIGHRWMPVITDTYANEQSEFGPACRKLKDAQDWCEWQRDAGSAKEADALPALVWVEQNEGLPEGVGPVPFVANVDEVRYEVMPVEVEE